MANNFKECFKQLIDIEGEWANVKEDRGGKTRWGISSKNYPEIDLDKLTIEAVEKFYLKEFWLKLKLDQIIDNSIAAEVFEAAVNSGRGGAVMILQRALNYLGENLEIDGGLGKLTLTATNYWCKRDPRLLLRVLNGVQFAEFLRIVEKDPTQKIFAKGWMKRIEL